MQVYIKIFIFIILASCLREKQEGYIFEEDSMKKIEVGQNITKIKEILGTPSFTLKGSTEEEILVYASVKKQFRAFFKPKTQSQTILKLTFYNSKLKEINLSNEISHIENSDKIITNIDVPLKEGEKRKAWYVL